MSVDTERQKILRKALFVPCETKEHLHRWIKIYLELDIPNVIVCDDDERNPPSNSSPMDLIWDIYSKALSGEDPEFTQVLGFAARDAGKTLAAAILETLCMFHLNRNVGHMAAVEAQARNCQRYILGYLKKPILREFVTSNNKRLIEITRYCHDETKEILSPVQFNALPLLEKGSYEEKINWIKIVMATVVDCNGLHAPFFVCDELDLADPAAFEESKMIPSMTEDGKMPITFLTSTRKYSFGLVQKEIDNAQNSGMHIKHWNIIDVTQACEPKRHLPDEPKVPIYYSEQKLRSISKDDWLILSEKEREQYDVRMGYAGCLKNCKLFPSCKGRLATKQTSKSKLLKPITHVQGLFQKISNEHAKAQLLCWKPSSEGLVYPFFSRERHMVSAADMATRAFGEDFPPNMGKAELINLFKEAGADFYCGLDWGFTHNFAVVSAALLGHVLYVFDVISARGLELHQKVELCEEKLKPQNPRIYPDSAYPSDIKTFMKAGFRMIKFQKDVQAGVEGVRTRLHPGAETPPAIFFLKGDPGCELVATKILQYHWKVDAQGNLTDDLDKSLDDDALDSLRYLCQNVPINKSNAIMNVHHDGSRPKYSKEDWMKTKIRELTGDSDENIQITGKPGGYSFTF